MAQRIKNFNGLLLLLVGIFLLLGAYGNPQRMAKPSFDGSRNFFKLDILDHADRAEVGDLYWVDLEVHNQGPLPGSMYVQCSILNRDTYKWLPLQSITKLDTDSNCADDEPFTQTAKVTLDANVRGKVRFNFRVPDTVGLDNTIWCEAYEQCYSENVDTMSSDKVVQDIEVFASDTNDANNNENKDQGECVDDGDCSSWFFNEVVCKKGACVDKVDANKNIDFTILKDSSIKDWISQHHLILIAVGVLLFLIGMFSVYNEPRQPRYRF